MKVLESLKRTYRDLGFGTSLLYYISEVARRVSGQRIRLTRYLIVAQPIPAAPFVKRPDRATLISQVDADDLRVASFPRPTNIIARRYAAENICLQAAVDGTFAGFLWLAFGTYEEDEVRCRYELSEPSRMVWDFDVYVEPRFRLGRTFVRLWDAANELLRNRGIRWSISRIAAFNAASLAAHARLGTVKLGYATFLSIGEFQLAILPNHRVPAISWNHQTRPTLSLSPPATTASHEP